MIGERVGGTTYGQELAVVTVLVGLTAAVVTLYSKQNDPTVPSLFFLAKNRRKISFSSIPPFPVTSAPSGLERMTMAWVAPFLKASSYGMGP